MIQGYKPKSVRKRKKFAEKENVKGNSAKRFTFPTSALTDGRHDTPPLRITTPVTGTPLTLRQTQSSSAHGGFQETAVFLSTPENTLNTTRTPLSNITNIVDDNTVPITRMYENNLRDTARNLFAETSSRTVDFSAETSSQTKDTAKCLRDDDNECSTVQDPVLPDDSDNGYISG
ncbi:hypothetical protein ACET3Z_018410 [Daucus carota]